MVNEEDTVTVGQDLVRLELGGEPSGGSKQDASSETKAPASKDQETSSQPSGEQEQLKSTGESAGESKPAPPKQEEKAPAPKQESKPQPPKKESKPIEEVKQAQPGSREERRVRFPLSLHNTHANISHRLR